MRNRNVSRGTFKFRLYVAGGARNSSLAVTNLNAMCHRHLPKCHEIEVVDVLREPKRALADSIFMTPTLVIYSPTPIRKIVGTLSQPEILHEALGLESPRP
jgi:circadian clock protein KaiB